MHVTTIHEKRGHQFERKQREVGYMGRVGGEKGKERNDVTIKL